MPDILLHNNKPSLLLKEETSRIIDEWQDAPVLWETIDIDGIMLDMSVEKLIFAACRGEWPESITALNNKAQLLIAKDYINVVCNEDISRIDNVQRNPSLARLILRSYGRNVCTLIQKTKMLADVSVEMEGISIRRSMIMSMLSKDCLSLRT